MLIEEILPLGWPANERPVPAEVRAAELARRNEANLRRWYVETFGHEAGPIIQKRDCNVRYQ